MPFYVYKTYIENDQKKYCDKEGVSLAGRNSGIIPKFFFSLCKNIGASLEPISWHASSRDLIEIMDLNPENHSIVIDLKPDDKNNISLYELEDIWGFTDDGWTPLLLKLKALLIEVNSLDTGFNKDAFSPIHKNEFAQT